MPVHRALMTPSRRTSAGGFTLLEVIVAFAILGIAVVASIQGFAGGLRLLKLSGDHQGAMLLADQKLREALKPEEGRESGTDGAFAWERTTAIVPTPELTPEVNSSTTSSISPTSPTTTTGPAAPKWRVYRIEVKVRWEQRSVQLVSLRTLPIEQTLVTQTGVPQTAVPQTGFPQTGLPQTGMPPSRIPQTVTPRP